MSGPQFPLAVRELTVPSRLAGVTFAVGRGELAALVGVSGAGKSSLLRVLAGLLAADGSGVVAGVELAAPRAVGERRIGYVPQSDALRGELRVEQELTFAARLRCAHLSPEEQYRRMVEVLGRLGLAGVAGRTISTLSAGERKRVSVAVEMLGAPQVLLLDEATSGIDPAHELTLLRYLKQLAADGCTILLATHSTLALAEFDRLVMLGPGGRLLFAGAPHDALAAAGVAHFPELFERTEPFGAVPEPGALSAGPDAAGPETETAPVPVPVRRVLVARELARLMADRWLLAFVAIQAPILGLLVRGMLGRDGLGTGAVASNLDARRALLTLTLSAVWLGSANAIREIVKDRGVLERDRVAGIGPGAQLLAKLVTLAVLSAGQAVVLVVVGVAGDRPPPAPPVGGYWAVTLIAALWLCAVAAGAVALAISALVRRTDYALAVLPVVLVPQLVLSGGVMPLDRSAALGVIADASSARWGFSLVAATTHLRELETVTALPVPLSPGDLALAHHQDADGSWDPDPATWWGDAGALAAIGLIAAASAWFGLRRRLG